MDALEVSAKSDAQFRSVSPITRASAGVIDRGSPPLGGGCQTNGTNGIGYSTPFHVADNFNVATTGTLTGVSWSGTYYGGTAVPFPNGTPPATETFIIRILSDVAGVPGAQLYTTTVTNPTRVNSGGSLPGNANFAAMTIWDYTASGLVGGPSLTAGTCYWLEITNTSTLTVGTNTGTFWVSGTLVPGDGVGMQDDTPDSLTNCGGYDVADRINADLSFCLNLSLNTLDGSNCPSLTLPPAACAAAANGAGVASTSAVGFNSASAGSVYGTNITGVFQRAENFSVTTGGNLTSLCFWGFFNQTNAAVTNNCARDFDIIVWNNDTATGQPSTVKGQWHVGTNGVTVSRTLDNNGQEVFTVSAPPAQQIALTANTCYHLTVSARFDVNDVAHSARFIWGTVPATTPFGGQYDRTFYSRAIPSSGTPGAWQLTTSATDNRFTCNYLLNIGPVGTPSCVPPPPGNDTCLTATSLDTPFGAVINGSNVNATHEDLPGAGFDLVDGPSVWYKLTGTGNDVQVSTCGASSPLDTILHVYCAPNGCAGPFNRVAGNDDDDTPCASNANSSRVVFATTPGTVYYVVVNGFQASQNTFQITATQGGASVNAPTCASLAGCSIDAEPFDVQETEACMAGTGLDQNGTCTTAVNLYTALGLVAKGSISTQSGSSTIGGFRDVDLWKMPAASAGQTVEVHVRAENPFIVQFLNDPSGTCTNIGTTGSPFNVVAGSTFFFAACTSLTDPNASFSVTLPAGGNTYFLMVPPTFGGSPCTLGLDQYRFQISLPVFGACCLLNTNCFSDTFSNCSALSAGDPTDFWTANQSCSPDPCLSQPGKCCFPDLTCAVVPSPANANASVCASNGGTYTSGGVCTPNTCMATNIACCRGSTCVLTSAASCTGSFQFATMATACNSPLTNGTTPCCRADFNHVGGIGVQDIFDFLGAYFTTNIFADANESGAVGVQDIFDFLAFYFTAGCP